MNITLPVISWLEFESKFYSQILNQTFENQTKEEILAEIVKNGWPRLDKENLSKSLAAIRGQYLFNFSETFCVDFADNMFYWCVSGGEAMLINKPK